MILKTNLMQILYGPVNNRVQGDTKGNRNLSRATLMEILITVLISLLCFSISNAQYCTPVYLMGCSMGNDINTFTVFGVGTTSINNVGTSCSPTFYDDRTNDSVTFTQGLSYTANISSDNSINVQVYIDFNDDFTFNTTTESVGGLNSVGVGLAPFTIAIPGTATPGPHRMRVIGAFSAGPPFTFYPGIPPCPGTTSPPGDYGEAHDYVALIVSSCVSVTGLAAGSITSNSATISWTAAAGSAGYQYVINTTAAAPTTSGTAVLTTSVNATSLSPSTTYYAHVRDSCGATTLSGWTTYRSTATLWGDYRANIKRCYQYIGNDQLGCCHWIGRICVCYQQYRRCAYSAGYRHCRNEC